MKSSPVIVILSGVLLIVTFFSCVISGITEQEGATHQNLQIEVRVTTGVPSGVNVNEPNERPSHQEIL